MAAVGQSGFGGGLQLHVECLGEGVGGLPNQTVAALLGIEGNGDRLALGGGIKTGAAQQAGDVLDGVAVIHADAHFLQGGRDDADDQSEQGKDDQQFNQCETALEAGWVAALLTALEGAHGERLGRKPRKGCSVISGCCECLRSPLPRPEHRRHRGKE